MASEQEIDKIFLAALELDQRQREAFLAAACDNSAQRREVASLIAAYQEAGSFLDEPIALHIDDLIDPLIGRAIGDFKIREKIGAGGFGAVYRAEQMTLAREAIVKVLHKKHCGNLDIKERFLQEARLASRLEHPYTAHVYAFGVEPDGIMWIGMEMVHGLSLDQLLLKQGPLPLDRFVPLLERICEVVQTAHESGIIHRDLKPANIMVIARAGRLLPKLLDFGIAKAIKEPLIGQMIDCAIETAPADKSTLGMLGSTAYMPAEQWENAANVDARGDIYALGVLSYEAITGQRPFNGGAPFSFEKLYQAHKESPAPLLDERFPAALNDVLARAMAKAPSARYAGAVDFANAFREAAGFADRPIALPQLDAALFKSWQSGAPQPLAAALSGYRMARNVHQAREHLAEIFRVLARYLGLLALAAQSRHSNINIEQREYIGRLLSKLRVGNLTEEEWLELAGALCRPWAAAAHTHPIPELVGLLCGERDLFFPMLSAQRELTRAAMPEPALAQLKEYLPELELLLRELAFLLEYRLVARRDDYIEQWMGNQRAVFTGSITADRLSVDKLALIDGEGRAILSLWPLMQVGEPNPGAPREIFLLEGKGRHGAKLIALPRGFERQDEAVWEWLKKNFLAVNESIAADEELEKPPYLGLQPFTAADAELFFGRERETIEFINRLRAQPLLTIVGASGAGKSSFAQAGILPELPTGWRKIIMRPGISPMATLAAKLKKEIGAAGDNLDLRVELENNPAALAEQLRRLSTDSTGLLLLVDQFEEIFTLCQDERERRHFAESLALATRSLEDPVRVIITLRDDFLVRAKQLPGLRDRLAQGLEVLATPQADDLLRILIKPAAKAGYQFEDEKLPREIVDAIADQPGALPLLAFTAARLWEKRDRHFKQILRKAYQDMGGVGGALAQHAESMMKEMRLAEQRLVRAAFHHLVTSAGTRAALARGELNQVLGGNSEAEAVIERLIAARLLTVSETESGGERIEVVHEALLLAWPRLVQWRQEEMAGARLRDQLRAAAQQWQERGRVKGLLWRDEALSEYLLWRSRYALRLTEIEEAFGDASRAEAERAQRRKRLAIAAILISLISGLLLLNRQRQLTAENARRAEVNAQRAMQETGRAQENALIASQEKEIARQQQQSAEKSADEAQLQSKFAEQNAERAQNQLLELYQERGRQELLMGNALIASVYLSEAYRQGKDDAAMRLLLAESMRAIDAQLLTLNGHNSEVLTVEYSPDGARIVTTGRDNVARVWNALNGKLLFELAGKINASTAVHFNSSGARIVGAAGEIGKIWDASNGKLIAQLIDHKESIHAIRFSKDDRFIVTAGNDNVAKIWDANDGRWLVNCVGHNGGINYAEFSPDGSRIVTASQDGSARIWQAATGQLLFTLSGHSNNVNAAIFSADGARIVTASNDGSAKIWDASNGRLRATLEGHRGVVYSAEFNGDNSRIVTASSDNTAKIWDSATGKLLASLEGHNDIVNAAHFSADNARVITASIDYTARVWDAFSGLPLAVLKGHQGAVNSAMLSPDGARIATASNDGAVKIWDANNDKLRVTFESHRANAVFSDFSPAGSRIITVDSDGLTRIWDGLNKRLITTLQDRAATIAAAELNFNGSQIVTIGDNVVKVWDVANGKMLAAMTGYAAAFSRDGARLATACADKTIKIWDSGNGRLIKSIKADFGLIKSVRFSPDGASIVVAGKDKFARVWQINSGKNILCWSAHAGGMEFADYSRDGKWIITAGDDNAAKIWDSANGKLLTSLEGHKLRVYSARFSADEKYIITASADKTAKIWDSATGRLLVSLEGHRDPIYSARFSANNEMVATTGRDNNVKIWRLNFERRSPEKIAELVKARAPFYLKEGRLMPTLDERNRATARIK